MFKKILIAAGTALSVIAAGLSFQSSANAANAKVSLHKAHHGKNLHGVKKKSFSRGHVNKSRGPANKKSFKHHDVKKKSFKKQSVVKAKKPVFKKKVHVHKPILIKKHHTLSNRKLRYFLREKGLYNIRFIDRHHRVATVIADNRRGYVGKYKVNTRNGHILDGHLLRYH